MTDIPMKVERKPDCAVCGQPYYRHNVGAVTTCPIIATYRPPTANPLPDEVGESFAQITAMAKLMSPKPDTAQLAAALLDHLTVIRNALEHLSTDRDSVIEECAKIVDDHARLWSDEDVLGAFGLIAAAIRARRAV